MQDRFDGAIPTNNIAGTKLETAKQDTDCPVPIIHEERSRVAGLRHASSDNNVIEIDVCKAVYLKRSDCPFKSNDNTVRDAAYIARLLHSKTYAVEGTRASWLANASHVCSYVGWIIDLRDRCVSDERAAPQDSLCQASDLVSRSGSAKRSTGLQHSIAC